MVIENIRPKVDDGGRPAKAAVGDLVAVEADVFADGHDLLRVELVVEGPGTPSSSTPMSPLGNDRWRGDLPVSELGVYTFRIRAMVDRFSTWSRDLAAWAAAGDDYRSELAVGAGLLEAAADSADGADRQAMLAIAAVLRRPKVTLRTKVPSKVLALLGPGAPPLLGDLLASPSLHELVARYPASPVEVSAPLAIRVDPERARCSAWYELFVRSASPDPGRSGTFDDVAARLPYIAGMGFDVVYLPPIHPIGRTGRKGPGGRAVAEAGDAGSPWAIGSEAGGHEAVHPDLGTLASFEALVRSARQLGMDIALDLAFQASPDHPWVTEHPNWFRHRPDGTIRYAENPPKRYQDIYPFDFDTEDVDGLWAALAHVVEFWIDRGVRIFRVDNPHTKPFVFWEWLIGTTKAAHPEVIFLAEAFTRPKVMAELAKLGFTQSYTYFTWRTAKWELEQYVHELTQTEMADYFRPNFWPNTPDILPAELQSGSTAAFLLRFVLASTLSANYGIYGPAFELQEHQATTVAGGEEYLDSEKYQQRHWAIDAPRSLAAFITRVNEIRHEHAALRQDRTVHFHWVDNDQLLAYSKTAVETTPSVTPAVPSDAVLVVANLDPAHTQSGWLDLDLEELGLAAEEPFVVHDLLTDARYKWRGRRNFVLLDPDVVPAHVLVVERTAAVRP